MRIPEMEVTQRDIALGLVVGSILVSCVVWFYQQTIHRDDSIQRWAEYDMLWEEPIEERRQKVRRALALLEDAEGR